MTDQNPELEELPAVSFRLRNMTGEGDLAIIQHSLGAGRYILVEPGEEGPVVSSSHIDFDALTRTLGFILAAAFNADEVSEQAREDVRELLSDQDV